MKDELDNIREKARIDELDSAKRKELFQKFVEHGGEVLKEQKHPKVLPKKGLPKTVEEKRVSKKEEKKPEEKPAKRKVSLEKRKIPSKTKGKSKLLDLLQINAKGLFYGVFNLLGNRFSDRFINNLNTNVKDHFINLHLTVGAMLKGESSIKMEITRISFEKNSIFFEILLRLSTLYDEAEFSSICKLISNKSIPERNSIEVFKQFFRRIYILGQSISICKLFIDRALNFQGKYKKIELNNIPNLKSQLKKDIDEILGSFLFQFHLILCKMDRKDYPLYSQTLDDFLRITEKDKIGYITQLERKKRMEELTRQKSSIEKAGLIPGEKEEIKIPKHIERGLQLTQEAIEKYESKHGDERENPLWLLDKRDKMYKVILLLEVFDKEYSFILTTSKVVFTIDYQEQRKVDLKEDLSNLYLLLSGAREETKDYLDVIEELKNAEDDLRLTQHQKSSMIETLSKKCFLLSRKSRNRVADAMKSISNTLSTVITDYRSTKRLLQNPDETLLFDRNIDGEKKLDGKRIIEAIVEAFLISTAYSYLLNLGELSGSGLLIEREDGSEDKK